MKHRLVYWLSSWVVLLTACEDEIFPTLETVDPVLAVDAWITDQPERQVVRLSQTQPYFETGTTAVTAATVRLSDSQGRIFIFTEDEGEPGAYYWTPPTPDASFGTVGETYRLEIDAGGQVYTATATMAAVPPIDSITYEFQRAFAIFPDTYIAEFWATDLPEQGNSYWIRTYKNGELLNDPNEISVAYDAGFTQGSGLNGVVFIQPIRTSINPFEQDENDETLPAYELGDSLRVELYSLSDPAYDFLNQVAIQTNRPGGFSELFANPLANVPTNIRNTDAEGPPAVGYFHVSSVSSEGILIR